MYDADGGRWELMHPEGSSQGAPDSRGGRVCGQYLGTSSLCLQPLLLAIKFSMRNTWACFHKQYTLCKKKNKTCKKGMERGKKVSAYKRGCWLEDRSYLFFLHDTLYMWSFLPNVGTYRV